MQADLVAAGFDQLDDQSRGQGAASKEDVGSSLPLVEQLEDELQLIQVAEARELRKVEVRAHPAEHVPQEWRLPIGAVYVDAKDERHGRSVRVWLTACDDARVSGIRRAGGQLQVRLGPPRLRIGQGIDQDFWSDGIQLSLLFAFPPAAGGPISRPAHCPGAGVL